MRFWSRKFLTTATVATTSLTTLGLSTSTAYASGSPSTSTPPPKSNPLSSNSPSVSSQVTLEKWNNKITILYKNKSEFDRKLDFITKGGSHFKPLNLDILHFLLPHISILVGKNKLQIIADFDYTMTKFFNEQHQRAFSCHALIEANQYVTEEYRKLATGLFHYYYPIEVSGTLTTQQKIPHMIEWVDKAHELMVERSGLRQSMIKLAVSEALEKKQIIFRTGVSEFLSNLDQHGVPILIFSAGLGDVIEELLSQYCNGLTSHLHIISNHMIFNNDHLVGFTSPSYHVFNKTAQSALNSPFFQRDDLLHRSNLLLFGDSIGDVTMCNGLSFHDNSIIKIGFLNVTPERLPEYLAVYDVVVLGDPGFEYPNSILNKILGNEKSKGVN